MLRDSALLARRFPFPIPGRRKHVLEAPPVPEPTSKAHRILGSTPLSIDAPPPSWDDASSITSDDRSATTATSYLGPHSDAGDLDDAHRVGIAKSDSGWGDDADQLDSPLRLDDDSDAACTALRKSRSSSTLRSWYDKSKLPLFISQQTSSAMAKGPPTAASRDGGKKKPARLDLSSLVPGSRSARKASLPAVLPDAIREEPVLGPDFMMKSPSVLSSAAPPPAAQRGPPATGAWPPSNAALSALPTLYDHYEQMCIRGVMRQCSQPEFEPVAPQQQQPPHQQPPHQQQPQPQQMRNRRAQQGRHGSECLDWLRDPVPPTPQTVLCTKHIDKPPPPCSSGPRRHTRTSRSFGSADLQQTSVLVLSSDSEEDDDDQDDVSPAAAAATTSPASAPARRPSNLDDALPLVASRQRPSKAEKHATFAPANTYITIPSAKDRARSPAPGGAMFRRSSFMSSSSSGSSATGQSNGGIRPMPPARRSSNADHEEQVNFDRTVFHRESFTSSVDQLTPPLSPTSVDFYMRSARSSVDGPGTHSQLMAVTRQEELLAALRQKQRSMRRGSALAELQESNEEEEEEGEQQQQQQQDQRRGSRSSKALDLSFPAPPSFAAERSSSSERGSTDRRRRRSRSRRHTQEEVVVPFYLDDTEPSPDLSDLAGWDAAAEPTPRRDLASRRRNSFQSGASGSHAMLHPESFARLAGVAEEDVAAGAEEDVPRPDSPISPESFPAVPKGRAMRSNKARLSAVGSGLLGGAGGRTERA